jgi:hypothetical protein
MLWKAIINPAMMIANDAPMTSLTELPQAGEAVLFSSSPEPSDTYSTISSF